MLPVSAGFLASLAGPHLPAIRAEVAADNGLGEVVSLPVLGGSVTATATDRVRRRAVFSTAEEFWPFEPSDPLSPYGGILRIWRGIQEGAAGGSVEEVAVFEGRVQTVRDSKQGDGQIEIMGADFAQDVVGDKFTRPEPSTRNAQIWAEIKRLLTATRALDFTNSTLSIDRVPVLLWQSDRAQAVDELASSIGAEWYHRPPGAWILRPVPTLAGAPVITLTDGENGVVVEAARSQSRDQVPNIIVVSVDRSDNRPPIHVVAQDIDASSPTFVGGPYGRVVDYYRGQPVTSTAQALVAGQAQLSHLRGLARTRDVTMVCNPALEPGDVIRILVEDQPELHIIDNLEIPLVLDQTARLATRSEVAA